MAFLYSYLTPVELEAKKEEAKFAFESMQIDHMYRKLVMEHELRLSDIELQVLTEGYDNSQLEDMYRDEMRIYTEGVKEAWEAFKNWLKGIIDAIFGKARDVTPEQVTVAQKSEEGIEVSVSPSGVVETLKKTPSIIRAFVKEHKTAGTAVAAITVFGCGVGVGDKVDFGSLKEKICKKERVTLGKLVGYKSDLEEGSKDLESATDELEKECKGEEWASGAVGFLRWIITQANNLMSIIVNAVKGAGKAVAGAAKAVGGAVVAGAGKVKDTVANAVNKDKKTDDAKEAEEVKEESTDLFAECGLDKLDEIEIEDFLNEYTESDVESFDEILDRI